MARKNDESQEYSIRFSLSGTSGDEADLLHQALQGAASNRKGSELLRIVAMRGWLSIIHDLSPRERVIMLRSLGLSKSIIQSIEIQWPKPLLFGGSESVNTDLTKAEASQANSVLAAAVAKRFQSSSVPAADQPNKGADKSNAVAEAVPESDDSSGLRGVPISVKPARKRTSVLGNVDDILK